LSTLVKYYLAQYLEDPFQREPKNIGVIISGEDQKFARFFGEISPGKVDRKRLYIFAYPEVYIQWIEYWRKQIGCLDSSKKGVHFQLVVGGHAFCEEGTNLSEVLENLFTRFVSKLGEGSK